MINVAQLDRDLQSKMHTVIILCGQAGFRILPIQGWRDLKTQAALYEQGLSAAKGFDGPHTQIDNGIPCSKAFDFACFDGMGNYIKDGTHPDYKKAGLIAKAQGLVWGGDWEHPDWDHIELPNWRKNG
jgi:hypothetical protein